MSNLDIIRDNPIFMRELRRRMRGKSLIWTMILYVAAMCGIAFIIISQGAESLTQYGGYHTVADIGQSLYRLVIIVQSLLVLIVAPTITAAMVRAEKEKQTFDFLRATSISSPTYVMGALLSTVLYVALALFCALPVLMLGYMYGGISNVLSATAILLAASIVLSSGGLLVSTITEKSRQGQGMIVFGIVFFAIVMVPTLLTYMIGRSTFRAVGGLHLAGVPVPEWIAVGVLAAVVSAVLLLIATRKLFNSNERALNYRQFGALYLFVILFGAIIALADPISLSSGGTSRVQDRMNFFTGLFIIASLLLQNTMILNRVDLGNERWRVKKRNAKWRDRDESVWYVALLTAIGAVMVFLCDALLLSGQGYSIFAVVPPLLFLAVSACLCKLCMKRIEDENRSLKTMVAIQASFLLLPVLAYTGRGTVFEPFAVIIQNLSPAIASSTLRHGMDVFPALFTLAFYSLLLVVSASVARTTKARHENTHVTYDLAL